MTNPHIFRRVRLAQKIVADTANWYEVVSSALMRRPLTSIQRRGGPPISARPEVQLWDHFNDIWYHHSYTRHTSIPMGAVVVDIGANIGLFALYAARTAATVYAIEPSTSNFEYLVQNTSKFANISSYKLAIAANDGRARLVISGSPTAYSLVSNDDSHFEVIETMCLDTFFTTLGISRCNFLKLDCEGAEYEIILNADSRCLERIDRIVLEYHDDITPYSHRDLLAKLDHHGFSTTKYKAQGQLGMIAAIRA